MITVLQKTPSSLGFALLKNPRKNMFNHLPKALKESKATKKNRTATSFSSSKHTDSWQLTADEPIRKRRVLPARS